MEIQKQILATDSIPLSGARAGAGAGARAVAGAAKGLRSGGVITSDLTESSTYSLGNSASNQLNVQNSDQIGEDLFDSRNIATDFTANNSKADLLTIPSGSTQSSDCEPLGSVTKCRFCRHFDSAGRRGGECAKLQSHVEGDWKSCSLAMPIFATNFETEIQDYPETPSHFSPISPSFIPNILPKLLPSMSPSIANILVNSSSCLLAGRLR
jgi:hypothetical protein